MIDYLIIIAALLGLTGCSIQLGIPPSINFGPPIPIGPQSDTVTQAATQLGNAQTIDKK